MEISSIHLAVLIGGTYLVPFFMPLLLLFNLLFLSFLYYRLSQTDSRLHPTRPWLVWLNLLPIFNLVWIFVTVLHISKTLEYNKTAIASDATKEARRLGLAFATFHLVAYIPIIGIPFSIITFITHISYWLSLHRSFKKIQDCRTFNCSQDEKHQLAR